MTTINTNIPITTCSSQPPVLVDYNWLVTKLAPHVADGAIKRTTDSFNKFYEDLWDRQDGIRPSYKAQTELITKQMEISQRDFLKTLEIILRYLIENNKARGQVKHY